MERKIKIKYLKKQKERIRIFGEQFVNNNEKILKMEIEGEKIELSEYYDNEEHPLNIAYIIATLVVSHFEISGKDFNNEHPLKR